MSQIVTKPDRGEPIGKILGKFAFPTDTFQNFFDDLEQKLNESLFGDVLQLTPHLVADVPSASDNEDAVIRVTDESTGAMIAISDGTDWRTAAGVVIS